MISATIVDFHCHLAAENWYPARFLKGVETLVGVGAGISEEDARALYKDIYDATGEKLIAEMDASGVTHAVIFPGSDYDMACGMGWAELPIDRRNEIIADIAARYNGRLIPFFSIDPRKVNALALFKHSLQTGAAKGLKLVPGAGFYANDKILYPFYELARDAGLPVLIHVGPVVAPMSSRYCDPYWVDDVAADFPDLSIVCAHSGFGYWPQMASIAMNKPNLFLEVAGWQSYRRKDPWFFYNSLRTMVNLIGSKRVIFGSDYPFISRVVMGHPEWVQAFTSVPEDIQARGISFQPNEIADILGNNAARLLRL